MDRSKLGRRSKRKGATYEAKISARLNERYPELVFKRSPRSGAWEFKEDIVVFEKVNDVELRCLDSFPLFIETKKRKSWAIISVMKKILNNCKNIRMGIFIFGEDRSEDFVCLRLEDFLRLLPDDWRVLKNSVR